MNQSTEAYQISLINRRPDHPLFSLGDLVTTQGAIDLLNQHRLNPFEFVMRHWQGDWGEVCEEDGNANNEAIKNGTRILSVYRININERLWIITEADRSVSTLLLPEEY